MCIFLRGCGWGYRHCWLERGNQWGKGEENGQMRGDELNNRPREGDKLHFLEVGVHATRLLVDGSGMEKEDERQALTCN